MTDSPTSASAAQFSLRNVRALLILLALVSCGPPFMHYRFIEPRLDLARYPFSVRLLPTEFLLLRFFGQSAAWFPAFFGGLFGWSFFRPASTRMPFGLGVATFLVFSTAYICYTLGLVAALITARHA
jgi:hypothetical protein